MYVPEGSVRSLRVEKSSSFALGVRPRSNWRTSFESAPLRGQRTGGVIRGNQVPVPLPIGR